MTPETRAFLDHVREAEDPTPEDEARVLSAVRATVAAGTLAGVLAASPKLVKLVTAWGVPALKVGSAAVLLVAAAGAADSSISGAVLPSAIDTPAKATPARVPASPETTPVHAPAIATPSGTAVGPRKSAPPGPRLPSSPAPSNRTASLREELALLAEVQAARRRGDGARALRLLDEHRTADTQLVAERAAARVLALCSTGRTDEARAAASDFLRRYPESMHRAAIVGACPRSNR